MAQHAISICHMVQKWSPENIALQNHASDQIYTTPFPP